MWLLAEARQIRCTLDVEIPLTWAMPRELQWGASRNPSNRSASSNSNTGNRRPPMVILRKTKGCPTTQSTSGPLNFKLVTLAAYSHGECIFHTRALRRRRRR